MIEILCIFYISKIELYARLKRMEQLITLLKTVRTLESKDGDEKDIDKKGHIAKLNEQIYRIVDNPYETITLHICAYKRYGDGKPFEQYDYPGPDGKLPYYAQERDLIGNPLYPQHTVPNAIISESDYKKLSIAPEMQTYQIATYIHRFTTSAHYRDGIYCRFGYFRNGEFVEITNTDLSKIGLVGLFINPASSSPNIHGKIRDWFAERNIQTQIVGQGPSASDFRSRDPPMYVGHGLDTRFQYMQYKIVLLSQYHYYKDL